MECWRLNLCPLQDQRQKSRDTYKWPGQDPFAGAALVGMGGSNENIWGVVNPGMGALDVGFECLWDHPGETYIALGGNGFHGYAYRRRRIQSRSGFVCDPRTECAQIGGG